MQTAEHIIEAAVKAVKPLTRSQRQKNQLHGLKQELIHEADKLAEEGIEDLIEHAQHPNTPTSTPPQLERTASTQTVPSSSPKTASFEN